MDKEKIKKIMDLSRLELSPEEKKKIPSQMREILNYMDNLNSLSTERIKPLKQVFLKEMPLFPDKAREYEGKENLTANSPFFRDGFFRIKKIIE